MDHRLALREQELPVLIHPEGGIPAGGAVNRVFGVAAGDAVISHIVIHTDRAAALGDPLYGVDLPVRAGVGQEDGIGLAAGQGGQGFFAVIQRRLLVGGQLLPIDVEGGPEGGGIADALNGLADPIISRRQEAAAQLPVQFHGHVFHRRVPALGETDALYFKLDRPYGLPVRSVPALQAGVGHGHPFRSRREPLLNHIYQGAACGCGCIHNHIQTPVGIRLGFRQHRGGKRHRVLPADFPQRHVGVHRHLHFGLGAGHETHADKHKSKHSQQADPEAGLAVIENGFDPVLHADLPEGHGTGRVVGPVGAAPEQRRRIGLSLLQLHKLHHPLVAGHLNVLAQKYVADPYQGIEPVQGQCQEADHFDPVISLVQMGPLVGKDLLAGLPGHAGGNVDFRLDEPQNKGGFDPVGFPAAGDLHGIQHLAPQMDVRGHAVGADDYRNRNPNKRKYGG